MTRGAGLTLALLATGAVLAAQQPAVQNGRIEPRQTASIDREVASFGASADPAWIGWRVPIADGERGTCHTWVSDDAYTRGFVLDDSTGGVGLVAGRPQVAPPAGPVQVESGTGLVVLARVTQGRVERLRSLGDDCPIDAGGRTIAWLTGVSPAASVAWLEGFLGQDKGANLSINARRSLATAALGAIALHGDPAADHVLDRVAADESDQPLRQQAVRALGQARGAHGFRTLTTLLAAERAPESRRMIVAAIGAAREPGTIDALRPLAADVDPKIRAEAIYGLAVRGGAALAPEVRRLLDAETSADVHARGVAGLARLPDATAIPLLIDLARSSTRLEVRKRAVSALGKSRDPRAVAFIQALLR